MSGRTATIYGCLVMLLLASTPARAGSLTLTWDASSGATGYRVHWGSNSGDYPSSMSVGNVTTATLDDLPDCATTYFAVTAHNQFGDSGFSNEVSSWPRPEVDQAVPASAMQGTQLSIQVDGLNYQPGAGLELDNPRVRAESVSVVDCGQLQADITVQPTAADPLPAETGLYSLTVTNPNEVSGVGSNRFEVLIDPARFDLVQDSGPSQGRLDGRDTILLARLFGSREGDPLFDPAADFNGDGWIDGLDLALLAADLGSCWTGTDWSETACS